MITSKTLYNIHILHNIYQQLNSIHSTIIEAITRYHQDILEYCLNIGNMLLITTDNIFIVVNALALVY